MGDYPYHEYEGNDPKKAGSYVRCRSNPCTIHGGSDIMAASAEEAYEKAHSDDVVHGLEAPSSYDDATPDELASFRRLYGGIHGYVSGSRAWYEAYKDDFLMDDSDDSILSESYDEMLLESHDYDNTVMPYITLYPDDDTIAHLPYGEGTQFSPLEAKQFVVYAARETPDSPIYQLSDTKLAHIVGDDKALNKAYRSILDDGMATEDEYDDEDVVEKHKRDDEAYSPYDRNEEMYLDEELNYEDNEAY